METTTSKLGWHPVSRMETWACIADGFTLQLLLLVFLCSSCAIAGAGSGKVQVLRQILLFADGQQR